MRRFHLCTLKGVAIRVDPTFVIVALFFAWLLATGFALPEPVVALGGGARVLFALAAMVGLAFSVVVVEIAHAFAAARARIAVHGVSLFLLGGVAEMSDEPKTPKHDLLLALAGPGAAAALALAFHSAAALVLVAASALAIEQAGVYAVVSLLRSLGWLNALIAGFNALPAFPLDGGRALRALLWKRGHSRAFATDLAAGFGKAFGVLFIVIGVLAILFDGILIGAWWAAIGVFLRRAARRATSTLVAHEALAGTPVARFVRPATVTVSPSMPLQAFIDNVVFAPPARNTRAVIYPVVEDGLFKGTVRARDLRRAGARIPTWNVSHLLAPATPETCISSRAAATDALAAMGRSALDRLFVLEETNGGERFVGVVLNSDLMDFVALKLEVDGAITDATYDAAVLKRSATPQPRSLIHASST